MNLQTHLATESKDHVSRAHVHDKMEQAIRNLHPGYGAMVMATGIVSLGAGRFDFPVIARLLEGLCAVAYVILMAAMLVRCGLCASSVREDFHDRLRASGFFTMVAATCILGTQLAAGHDLDTAWLLWLVGAGLWVFLTYAFFSTMIGQDTKPPLRDALDGGWLVVVVATQSVSILGTILAVTRPGGRDVLPFLALSLYLLGDFLYLLMMALLLHRLLVQPLTPAEFTPPYWINMGAAAITTLAGGTLISHMPPGGVLASLRQFLTGLTLLFWATATWWIPLLVILEIRRHVRERSRPRYDPGQWDIVFPLGMYAVATDELTRAAKVPFLGSIAHVVFWAALLSWTAVGAGGLYSLRDWLAKASPEQAQIRR